MWLLADVLAAGGTIQHRRHALRARHAHALNEATAQCIIYHLPNPQRDLVSAEVEGRGRRTPQKWAKEAISPFFAFKRGSDLRVTYVLHVSDRFRFVLRYRVDILGGHHATLPLCLTPRNPSYAS